MADIRKLKGISKSESELFRKCGINTVEDLWLSIDEGKGGPAGLATKSHIEKSRLIDLLVAEGMREPGRFGASWLKSHWLDIFVLAITLLLVLGIWRR